MPNRTSVQDLTLDETCVAHTKVRCEGRCGSSVYEERAVSYHLPPSCTTPAASKDGKLCQDMTSGPENVDAWRLHWTAWSLLILDSCRRQIYNHNRRDIRIWNKQPPPEIQMNFTMILKHTDSLSSRQMLRTLRRLHLLGREERQSSIFLQHHHQCPVRCLKDPMQDQRRHYQRCHPMRNRRAKMTHSRMRMTLFPIAVFTRDTFT